MPMTKDSDSLAENVPPDQKKLDPLTDPILMGHLRAQYHGVFNEPQLHRHVHEYVGSGVADQLLRLVKKVTTPRQLLDIGSGYGSFVLSARRQGIHAVGIEPEPFEVAYARRRMTSETSNGDSNQVFLQAKAQRLPFPGETFDTVTFWNVLEHIPDLRTALAEAWRVLRPSGFLFIVCPNYAAFRREAHYHLLWPPLLRRRWAAQYLRFRGRNPRYFENNIHYRSQREVVRALRGLGFVIRDLKQQKLGDPSLVNSAAARRVLSFLDVARLRWAARLFLTANFHNPCQRTVSLYAQKPASGGRGGEPPF